MLSVLLVLAVTAAAVALIQQRAAQAQQLVAQQQLRIATARELITEADASLADDPFEALQLGIAAQGIEENAETRASLVTSLISTRYAGVLTAHSDVIAGLALSPEEKRWPVVAKTRNVASGISLTSIIRRLSVSQFWNPRARTRLLLLLTEQFLRSAWLTGQFTCGSFTTLPIQYLSVHPSKPMTGKFEVLGSGI